jgi:hypothetical protein
MLYDNPAASLQAILERGALEKHDQPCHVVWTRILDVKSNDPGGLFASLGAVMDLPRRTLILVQASFPNQAKTTQLWTGQIESAFMQQSLNGQWGSFAAHISPYCTAHLSLTAELIQTKLGSKLLIDEDLAEALSALSDLISEIDKSSLDGALKVYLTKELAELQHSIRNYKLTGAVPILRHAESMLGHSLLDPAYSNFLTNHALGARLLENLSAMANLLTVATSLPQLTQTLGTLFLR